MKKPYLLAILGWTMMMTVYPAISEGQTFSSGSTGVDGPFAPTASVALDLPPSGIFNFTTINIPSGVTVGFNRNGANTPVTFLASGDVTIAGTINVDGKKGGTASGLIRASGGAGGPGGFDGGEGGIGGANPPISGRAGRGPGGGNPCAGDCGRNFITAQPGDYGASSAFVSLMPLFGGSGGGGAVVSSVSESGGGGGGAILIASSGTITLTGGISAVGGGRANSGYAREGSGGAIRLVAKTITGTGNLLASTGKIRLEAFNFSFAGGTVDPFPNIVLAPGPISASSNPSLLGGLPTLAITSIGGATPPASPTGSFTTPDLTLAAGTANPISVTLSAKNTPVGTVFTVRVIPSSGALTSVSSGPSTGTFSSSTANANVTLEQNQANVLLAFAGFVIPQQIASLLPRIDGEEIERVLLAAGTENGSTLSLVTRSGKEYPAKEILGEEKLAALWSGLPFNR